jgi:hypothetical protein
LGVRVRVRVSVRVGGGGGVTKMREEGPKGYGESNAGGEQQSDEVKIEIHKARHEKEGVGKPRTPRPPPQSMTC